jgi:hypothetical protein
MGLSVLIPAIIQYFLLLHKKKYLDIVKEFGNEDKKCAKKGRIFVWLYIGITLIMFFGLLYFQMKINQANV